MVTGGLANDVEKAMKAIMSLGLAALFGRHMNSCRMNGDSVQNERFAPSARRDHFRHTPNKLHYLRPINSLRRRL